MFVFTGWAGTFLLGVYLLKNPYRTRTMYFYLIIGLLIAVIGDGVAPLFAGAGAIGFFHDYLSFDIVIASAALFLILAAVPANMLLSGNPAVNRVVNWVGKNTLGIYLVHIMVLETIEYGYLGLKINMSLVSPIVEIPLLTSVTLVLTCVLIYGLKKIPYADKILG
jgi:peptidoglycan/LPS O-acetylase OafA/YrhL